MCYGAEGAWVPLVVSALGAGASYMSAEKADAERKRALLRGIESDEAIQDKANAETGEYVKDTFDPTTRAENYETGVSKNEEALGQLLSKQAELGRGDVNAGTAGAVSDTYVRARARATADQATKARTSARLLSRAGGAGSLFGDEALAGADYASNMLGFGVDQRLNMNRTQADYGAANGGNNLALLGGLLSGASRAYGGTTTQPKPGG